MSFRDLRNFLEMLRALGYQRQVSMESFRTPNFPLVGDILRWLALRFEPNAELPSDIETEQDRVFFIKALAQFMATKAHVKLNTKKLYRADGYAVQELLKAASVLYSAMKQGGSEGGSSDEAIKFNAQIFDLSTKLNDLKASRAIVGDITAHGASVYDLLAREVDLRDERGQAIARPLDVDIVEKGVRQSLHAVQARTSHINKLFDNIASDEANLEAKIEKKKVELDRNQKRLKSLQSVRPAFMDEYEKLEVELAKLYEVYVEKFRNLTALEHQLEEYNLEQQNKLEETEQSLKAMQNRMREEEMRQGRGAESDFDAYGGSESYGGSAPPVDPRKARMMGTMSGGFDDAQSSDDNLSEDNLESGGSGLLYQNPTSGGQMALRRGVSQNEPEGDLDVGGDDLEEDDDDDDDDDSDEDEDEEDDSDINLDDEDLSDNDF